MGTRRDGRIDPGQKLAKAISARAWNRAQDAADIVLGQAPGVTADANTPYGPPFNYVYCRNNTSQTVPRFGVMRISGVEVQPGAETAGGTAQFVQMPVVSGLVPDASNPGRWGVAIEPIAAGLIGRLAVAGVVQCKVRVVNTGDRFVRSLAGNVNQLVTGGYGEGLILWSEATVGEERWALIRLATPAGVALVQFDGSWPINTNKTVTFFGSSDTATARNRLGSVGSPTCGTRFGAVTLHNGEWNLIAAQCS
jgi:hypothetical protein